jgi:16S rRNA (cytidine1402-2'-O)-methyltransferase
VNETPAPDDDHAADDDSESEHYLQRAKSAPGPVLSIISTPIGNLEDITLRALRTLREADLVLAEDTRRTRVLCQQHGIRCNLRAFHAYSDARQVEQIVSELEQGKRVALVTDAGTPLLSDPGAVLVAAVQARGLRVETIPGPSAITAALTVAGLAVDHFRFLGFLPRSGKRRQEALTEIVEDRAASVVFESPQRLRDTLEELAGMLDPQREVAVCRELTKLHEEVVRGPAAQLAEHFHAGARGEITLVIAGRERPVMPDWSDAELDEQIRELLASGSSARDAALTLAARSGVRKQLLYARIQALKAPK